MAEDRGVSEVMGTILMVAIVLILATALGGAALTTFQNVSSETPVLQASFDVTTDSVSVQHRGGESIEISDLQLVLRNESQQVRYQLSQDNLSNTSDSLFEPGEWWSRQHSLTFHEGSSAALLIHTPSDKVLAEWEGKPTSPTTTTTPTSTSTTTTTTTTTTTSQPATQAYDDENGNGVYDSGETTYSKSELYSFNEPSANLVIPTAVGELNRNAGVSITANSITSEVDIGATWGSVSLTASGGEVQTSQIVESNANVDIRGATVDISNGEIRSSYGDITISATEGGGGQLSATGAFIETGSNIILESEGHLSLSSGEVHSSYGDITISATRGGGGQLSATGAFIETNENIILESKGDMILDSATVQTSYGQITADLGGSNTIHISETDVIGTSAIEYTPSGVTEVPERNIAHPQ
ncbi:Cell surface protein [Halanaeroarchaeum sp. HSR-CO]|uniref:type IV pilin n=1 Tax=Halanaeroarchaeum sp. HSR-CO TaxID=2866382 RepID=UPI00217EA37C|nr:type IV pilin N-terminal domain-containing protein [Halanaeroarchaeum sp. HSR-CO]UWG48189.1 Cell surface protein [Halanaeroarchaeum sp. HSR-CO]